MVSTNFVRRSPVPFSLIDPSAVRLLSEYICKRIKNIPHPMRFNTIKKQNANNLQCFINLYHQDFLDGYEGRATRNVFDYEKLSNLYDTVLSIINGIEDNLISQADFDIRCRLLWETVPMAFTDMQKYLDGPTLKFNLFSCISDLIINDLELSEQKREILKHRLCYSKKDEMLTAKEMALKLGITRESVYAAQNTLERKISDIIRKFKVLAPYCSYKTKYLSNMSLVALTPAIFDRIRREEKADDLTAGFMAKVLSVLYNYTSENISADGIEEYLLVHRGIVEMNKIIRFGEPFFERN
jgi:DNA-binding CsgD family transcriptional regulator